jgi:hypothetical protein
MDYPDVSPWIDSVSDDYQELASIEQEIPYDE